MFQNTIKTDSAHYIATTFLRLYCKDHSFKNSNMQCLCSTSCHASM